jgi:hypothetical protein
MSSTISQENTFFEQFQALGEYLKRKTTTGKESKTIM